MHSDVVELDRKQAIVLAVALSVLTASQGCGWRDPGSESREDAEAAKPLAQAVAPSPTEIALALPNGQSLLLTVPAGSQVDSRTPRGAVLEADIVPPAAEGFMLCVKVLGDASLMPGFASDASLRQRLAEWSATFNASAGAPASEPAQIEEASIRGCYTTAVDPEAGPDGYRHALNGFFCIDGQVVMLGGLYNEQDASGSRQPVDAILAAIRSAHVTGGPVQQD